MTAALPVSVAPQLGESIESWLEHLADANGLTTARLLAATGRGRAGNRYLTLAPSPETITHLAALTRVDEDRVYAATLASFDGTALDLTGLQTGTRTGRSPPGAGPRPMAPRSARHASPMAALGRPPGGFCSSPPAPTTASC